jgi:phosphoglycolate phosphatase
LAEVLNAVIFDLDGTLVDTPYVIVQTALAALEERGCAGPTADAIRATIGLPLTIAFSGLLGLPEAHGNVQGCVAEYRRLWRERVVPRSKEFLYPGVLEGIAQLHQSGLRLGVATSKVQAGAVAQLEMAGIAQYFDAIAGYDAVAHPKPAPDLALHVLGKLGVAPKTAIVVGDTTHDLLMARAAGLRAIAVTYGAQSEATLRAENPAFVAEDFPGVLAILKSLG